MNNLVFLLDVDNTLLDNDTVERGPAARTERAFGRECHERYWQIFEQQRAELGYADYLGALQRYRVEHPREPTSSNCPCSCSTIRSPTASTRARSKWSAGFAAWGCR